jgi:thiol-disulfide isomerase/thioredoxin
MPELPSLPARCLPAKRLSGVAAGLLYAALAVAANPARALEPADLEALRAGDMRKLVVHDEPVPAPDVAFTAPDGSETTLADSDGRVRLVNFWATCCAPCRAEMPALDALERELGGPDFQLMTIATGRNSPEAIDEFFAEVGTSLPTALDPKSALARAMNVPGLPVTVLLDRDGNEVARLMGGAEWDSGDAKAIVGAMIAEE